ncbi:hypothetical protein DID88_003640 [Monilinia fructigena]|uniref:ASX DEUBAD domain-containing protein n=1 Tax=Monilinia fructigena TaxID=38457 RepID=A0A395IU93_9HELO|nr:hypothetical protein DID88_003640 [Monilinia fructigena]
MAARSISPAPVTAASPSSPVLGALDAGIDPQTTAVYVATPISVSEASSAAHNEEIGVLDPISSYEVSAQRRKKQFPGERPLSGTGSESYLPEASSARGTPKPVLKKAAPNLRGGLSENNKVYFCGGGPKKRRGGVAGGTRKKTKQDKYSDVDQLLSDSKSPIFQEHANIKAVIYHPVAKQTMIDQAADFKLDGIYGRFDSDWIAQAMEASQTRAAGGYDAYLASQFEEQWAEEDEEVSEEEIKEFDESKNEKGTKTN